MRSDYSGSHTQRRQSATPPDPYDGRWHFSLTPYLWTPNINGSVDARIPTRSAGGGAELRPVNLSTKIEPNDYLENLQFGAMLIGEARKGDWTVITDFF